MDRTNLLSTEKIAYTFMEQIGFLLIILFLKNKFNKGEQNFFSYIWEKNHFLQKRAYEAFVFAKIYG